ncbi:hypothetical protein I350_00089 [Cryptococcus amylolentus CBS 6273]|uniref:DUF6534 domain-containing protein n=1 Tax=Cryptococcus amylolentus CBS 6273 TaxID=1296118 RepID=A0A1E3KEJ2_9TREE|nr:hypothetical protein I350_00089 [Cryptococcus amylolentus CBS 6273]
MPSSRLFRLHSSSRLLLFLYQLSIISHPLLSLYIAAYPKGGTASLQHKPRNQQAQDEGAVMASLEELGKASIDANPVGALMPLFFAMGFDSLLSQGDRISLIYRVSSCYFSSFSAAVVTFYTWAWMMDMFTYKYRSYAQFIDQRWWAWYPMICSCCKIPVQVFYGERAWRINNCNPFILISIGICLHVSSSPFPELLSTVGSFVWSVMTHTLETQDFTSVSSTLALMFFHLWPTACVVADFITTSSLLYGLHKSRNGWQGTDRLILRLMRIAVEVQVPATIAALVVLTAWSDDTARIAVFFVYAHILLNEKCSIDESGFSITLPKWYLTGALSVLNSRETEHLRGAGFDNDTTVSSHPPLHWCGN